MEDFLSQHSEFYRTLSEFPEGTTVGEVLEQAGCSTDQLAALMELEDQNEDIYNYAFGGNGLLYKSLKDQDISELLRVAEFLCLSPEIIRKLRIQLGVPETLKMLVPANIGVDFKNPKFWIALDNVEGFKKTFRNDQKRNYCETAAKCGSLKCLKWAHNNGCPWNEWTCAEAAQHGELECLKWARENGCQWNDLSCIYAAEGGHLKCLKWVHQHGCNWTNPKFACTHAARSGNLEVLKWVHANGYPWDKESCSYAAAKGVLEMLKWAHENGCTWDKFTCQVAATEECLQYAHQNGCPWDQKTCHSAAETGRLSCLQYARQNGCPWNKKQCLTDAKTEEIKEWIREQPDS